MGIIVTSTEREEKTQMPQSKWKLLVVVQRMRYHSCSTICCYPWLCAKHRYISFWSFCNLAAVSLHIFSLPFCHPQTPPALTLHFSNSPIYLLLAVAVSPLMAFVFGCGKWMLCYAIDITWKVETFVKRSLFGILRWVHVRCIVCKLVVLSVALVYLIWVHSREKKNDRIKTSKKNTLFFSLLITLYDSKIDAT